MTQTPAAARPLRILVVDDDVDTADSQTVLLNLLGHHAKQAYSGRQALRKARQFQPDVVLLDLALPDLSGYEVLQRLRATPEGRQVKAAAISGWSRREDRLRAQAAGFDHFIAKPADEASLLAFFATVLPPP